MNEERRGNRGKVLVVEDQPDNRRLAVKVLQRAGFETVEASRAEQIVPLVQSERPDLLLIDIELPDQNGLAAVQRLRADPATNQLPIVAVTAYASAEDRSRCISAGCSDYIAKPIDINELVEIVSRYVGQQGLKR